MTEPSSDSPVTWWRPLHRADRYALWFLLALPSVVFIVPALLGHPAIAQDNFIQNYPLRVLSASQIRSGHLPLLNPLADSGTPLLGGLNAGSFYPLSLIFVVLPSMVAWILNLIVVYVTAAVGVYALCRWLGVGSLAALLGAATYAYAGSMMGQMVHLGVVEGSSLLPWLILCELVAARRLLGVTREHASLRDVVRTCLPSVLTFTVLWALIFLTGEPRAIADAELLTGVVMVVLLVQRTWGSHATWRGRCLFVGANITGALWGAGFAMAQLLPGWAFIGESQRAAVGYHFFGDDSLPLRLSAFFFDQVLVGGNGVLGPRFFGSSNLAEVSVYVGLIAVIAVVAFFVQVTRRGWTGRQKPFALFAILIVVGLLATWGSDTPLGHVFHSLPLFGETRIQSRNVILVDLGAAVLLAWWLDAVFARRLRDASLLGWRRVATIAPVVVTLGLATALFVAPGPTEHFFGAVDGGATGLHETVTLAVQFVIALAALALLRAAWRNKGVRRWVVVLIVADLVAFNLFADVGLAEGSTSSVPRRASVTALLGDSGRYAIEDPGHLNYSTFQGLGVPNLNVFTDLASVEGYGSLITPTYSSLTGTHPLIYINRCTLATGTFRQLRLDTLVVAESAFAYGAGTGNLEPSCSPPTEHPTLTKFFGSLFTLQRIDVSFVAGAVPRDPVTIQLLDAGGHALGAPLRTRPSPTIRVDVNDESNVAGFTVSARGGVDVASTQIRVVQDHDTTTLDLNSEFQDVMDSSAWRLETTKSGYAVFKATSLLPAQWLESPNASSRIVTTTSAAWGDEWITVDTTQPTILVRSVAWLDGWRATLTSTHTGRSLSATVEPNGLIQQVAVPPGSWIVHFHYHAPYIELGLGVSAIAAVLFVVVVTLFARQRLRAKRRARVIA